MLIQNFKERESIVVEPAEKANATVIMLHGFGADAGNLSDIANYMPVSKKRVRFIFPNAPLLPVTLNGGMLTPAWYDILGLTEDSKQDKEGILRAKMMIEKIINQEFEKGISYQNIFLGGFSQGGALALYTGLHCENRIGGVIGLSTYLPIADSLSPQHQALSVFMAHGKQDVTIPIDWARLAVKQMRAYGCDVDWYEYSFEHTINAEELMCLNEWIEKRLGIVNSPQSFN